MVRPNQACWNICWKYYRYWPWPPQEGSGQVTRPPFFVPYMPGVGLRPSPGDDYFNRDGDLVQPTSWMAYRDISMPRGQFRAFGAV